MPDRDLPPKHPLDDLLRRDAARIEVPASDLTRRVREALRETEPEPRPLPFPQADGGGRWHWYLAAAAALLLLGIGLEFLIQVQQPAVGPRPLPGLVERAEPPAPMEPAPFTAPPATPEQLAAVRLNPFSVVPEQTPLDSELAALGHDVRSTGSFLLGCLPGYLPGSAQAAPR